MTRGGGPTAIERRGLIALAIVLVAAVAAIAIWRGDVAPAPADAASEAEVAAVERAAAADSASRKVSEKKKSPRKAATGKKHKQGAAQQPRRSSPLDEAID